MSKELEEFINSNREAFENRTPDSKVLDRIQEQMRESGKKKGVWVPMQLMRLVAACLILVAGVGGFFILQKNPQTKTLTAVTASKELSTVSTDTSLPLQQPVASESIAKTDRVVVSTVKQALQMQAPADQQAFLYKQALFAKLNDMESPGQRITATSLVYELKNSDKEIVDALVKTMNTDPNTNVRLAALEALSRFHREAYVKKQLITSLPKQKDPMVQIELIQLLTRMKETTILKELDKIVDDRNTIRAVKDHAYSSIFMLRS